MPELPDILVYTERLERLLVGEPLQRIELVNPFVLRTALPPIATLEGKRLMATRHIGKRIVLSFESDLFLVIHLMIAGRLRWLAAGAKPPGRITLATFTFAPGMLVLTEAGIKRRASMHLVQGETALASFDPGGLDVMTADLATFSAGLLNANHTLKRALTDPHLFAGIGNAYSDEILHRARLSPIAMTQKLSASAIETLYAACRDVLREWTVRLRTQAGDKLPEKVTAFHPEMAVHGRFGLPCPVCGAPVQRIVYADNETNYCPRCQTGGVILADRALSRLLKSSWPRSLDDLG